MVLVGVDAAGGGGAPPPPRAASFVLLRRRPALNRRFHIRVGGAREPPGAERFGV